MFVLIAPSVAAAQCPAGIPAGGNPACVPPDVYYSTQPGENPPPLPSPRWQTRWGAVAGGGGFGASVNMTSKRAARKQAIDRCKQTRGAACDVVFDYYNQCIAVASGGESSSAVGKAGDIEVAKSLANRSCEEGGEQCQVYYAECSYPVRVR